MRSFLTYGLISLAGVSALYACGDDDGGGTTTPGGGGSAGMGAGATGGASGGTSMSGAGGGGSGGGGAGGMPGIGPAPASNCTGCVQLSVAIPATPVTANGSQAGYIFSAPAAMPPFDLTNVTQIVWQVQALTTPAGAFVQPILQNAPPEDPAYAFGSYPAQVALTAAMFAPGMFVDVAMDVSMLAGGGGGADAGADAGDAGGGTTTLTAFDKSKVRTVGFNVGAGAAATPGWVSVELNGVTVTGTSNFTSKTFDGMNLEGLSLNMYQVPPGTLPPAAK